MNIIEDSGRYEGVRFIQQVRDWRLYGQSKKAAFQAGRQIGKTEAHRRIMGTIAANNYMKARGIGESAVDLIPNSVRYKFGVPAGYYIYTVTVENDNRTERFYCAKTGIAMHDFNNERRAPVRIELWAPSKLSLCAWMVRQAWTC